MPLGNPEGDGGGPVSFGGWDGMGDAEGRQLMVRGFTLSPLSEIIYEAFI